ncbi:App1 family protein [Larsenimonas rhizosphaerae]|uniref:DUF2183 domain-containing protein n=1 Tax=Larsenimonas rhizosphaerae TaxID=2944682 RepID=A0AA42CVC6_9GAMM|nr:phosphatase domain-containing protein [Larsenimonas rhizosphaerae]MCM2131376.1 DUF2183 domain-containing protein [Larsenimonas rhizosphaerae]MCX2525259.1 DUF2183 domain-containing protein [Larsenimonas rhizosphaerae]
MSRRSRAAHHMFRKLLRILAKPVKGDHGHGGTVIYPYRGYGSANEVFMMGRVFHQPSLGMSARVGVLRDMADIVRRMVRWGLGNRDVAIRLGQCETVVTTDKDGYFHAHVKLATPLSSDTVWHKAELKIMGESSALPAVADIYVPPASIDMAVISDIDDTVMYTGVANKVKMMYRLFMEKADERTAFPGVAPLYQALHGGLDGNMGRPMLYVSRGPWSIYEILEAFFNLNNIPAGPVLFLREWGLTLQHPLPKKAEDHKSHLIENMLALYDDLPFLLVGDSGQKDPEIYADIVRRYPNRICAIYIRSVHKNAERDEAIARLKEEVGAAGCELVLTSHSADMARHAFEKGYISRAGMEAVCDAT